MKFMNRKFVWLLLSVIVFSLQTSAQERTFDESVLSERGKKAYQTLLKMELFAIGGIGYSGTTSEGEKTLDILVDENEALPAFKSLVNDATIEGGLYGLLGLKMLGCECFQAELINFKKVRTANAEFLTIQSGCEVGGAQVSSNTLEYITKNFEQLAARKNMFREQRKKNEKKEKQ